MGTRETAPAGVTPDELLAALPALSRPRLLVIGDVFLDVYLIGEAERLSREAPIPVLAYSDQRDVPGGAANPAMNAVALGAQATLVGLVGDDDEGRRLAARLAAAGVGDGLVRDPERATARKIRLVAQGSLRFPQQIARIDRVERAPLSPATRAAIVAQAGERLAGHDAVLCSDYRSGLLDAELVAALRETAWAAGCRLAVDAQGALGQYRGFDLVRCNHHEAAAFLGRPLAAESDYPPALAEMLTRLEAGAVVVGRAGEGLSLRSRGGPYRHVAAHNRSEVFDVTGAGDTASAVLTLGLAGGLALETAATLAAIAAGLVVRRLGNATPTIAELREAIETTRGAWPVPRET
jgi:rfaE bifunctional protein kinase chain/domain